MLINFNFLSTKLGMQTNVSMFIPSATFEDQILKRNRTYHQGVKFQVLYLLHGGSGDNEDYVKFTNIVRYAQDNNIVVVMPNGYNSFYANNTKGTIPSLYWDYVFEELPEVVAAYFPISTKVEDTFVAGLSMGGHGAMKMAIMGSQKFNSAYIMSGVVMDLSAGFDLTSVAENVDLIVSEDNEIYKQAALNIKEKKALPKLFITTGDKDFLLAAIRKSKDLLIDLGYDVDYSEKAGFGHEWDFWDLALKEALYEKLPLKRKPLL